MAGAGPAKPARLVYAASARRATCSWGMGCASSRIAPPEKKLGDQSAYNTTVCIVELLWEG